MPRIKDVYLTQEFIKQYDNAPLFVQKAVDSKLDMIAKSGKLPSSFKAHIAKGVEGRVWIGWITKTNQFWRVLYTLENSIMTMFYLADHDDVQREIKRMYP